MKTWDSPSWWWLPLAYLKQAVCNSSTSTGHRRCICEDSFACASMGKMIT